MSTYTMTRRLDAEPADAEQQVRDALAAQGFGILTEIDVEATLREKLGAEIGHYVILGACMPPLAQRAIEADAHIGALLPCNVVVRAHPDGGSEVVAADPATMLELSPAADAIEPVAAEARQRIGAALDEVAG